MERIEQGEPICSVTQIAFEDFKYIQIWINFVLEKKSSFRSKCFIKTPLIYKFGILIDILLFNLSKFKPDYTYSILILKIKNNN